LKFLKCHRAGRFNDAVAWTVLPESQVRAQIIRLDIPYRIKTGAAKAGWSTVLQQMLRIIGRDGHSASLWQYRIAWAYRKNIWRWRIAGADSQLPAGWPDARQAIRVFFHAPE
jgi:hypothetical protein